MTRKRYDQATRDRVIQAAKEGNDWQLTAQDNGVNLKTAWMWIDENKRGIQRGPHEGRRYHKLNQEHVDFLVGLLSEDCQLTLKYMADKILSRYNIEVSIQTVKNQLDGGCFTLKLVHKETQYMNTDRYKEKRRFSSD
ncbi:hypothetical protein AC1031_021911 [Aphanomyces cochlioides]|nr:hypothetical protein AC1031_021911 [Aphanomyces cochlioides]